MGILSSAISNHLLFELEYDAWIVSLVVSMISFGFLVFTLFLGHISDKFGQKNVFRVLFILKLIFHLIILIPIKSNFHLVIFSIINFLNGGLNGIFWPTIQSISVYAEKKGGNKERNRFMGGYNFSWNFGSIISMILGSIFVYLTNSNYFAMILVLLGSIAGVIISFGFLGDFDSFDIEKRENSLINEENNNALSKPKELNKEIKRIFEKIFIITIILILATHSLTDGAHRIAIPLKLAFLSIPSFWVFLLTMFKSIARMISTTLFSHLKEEKTKQFVIISILTLISCWILFIFGNHISLLVIIMFISGTAQGCIYALGMKIMSIKARKLNTSKPFTLFQATMSGGRMLGPLIIGFTSTISIYFGVWMIIIFDVVSMIQFILVYIKMKKISE